MQFLFYHLILLGQLLLARVFLWHWWFNPFDFQREYITFHLQCHIPLVNLRLDHVLKFDFIALQQLPIIVELKSDVLQFFSVLLNLVLNCIIRLFLFIMVSHDLRMRLFQFGLIIIYLQSRLYHSFEHLGFLLQLILIFGVYILEAFFHL